MRVKAAVARERLPGVAVAVTSLRRQDFFSTMVRRLVGLLSLLLFVTLARGAVLPEDRADLLYHSYSGGGADINGPSLLLRKKFAEDFSVTANYYVDNVSSASIDVVTTASPYEEQRTEYSLGMDYLRDRTIMSLGYTNSVENDYTANTWSLGISQDMFGDLTTVSLGFIYGDNTVGRNGDSNFEEPTKLRDYRVSLSQILTQDLIVALTLETITDEGFLNNPYRSVRYLDPSSSRGYSYQAEVYPRTRTTNSIALRGRYYLPERSAVAAGYRYFTGSWGIQADTWELGYTLPWREDWIFEFSYRFYDQDHAEFYSDLFPYRDAQNFLARDKEMSSFTTETLGAGVTWYFEENGTGFIKRGTLNMNIDRIAFDYRDFRDLTVTGVAPGEEPLYAFNSTVLRLFLSIWF